MMQEQDEHIAKRPLNGILSNFDYQKKELSQRHLKELRMVVRKNEKVIPRFVDRLFEEFQKQDCDRRLGTILVADYFFQRSHAFRTELLDHIQDLLLYTLETDPLHFPLPPPLEAAACLKRETLKIVKSWIDKFSVGYQKLKTAAQFLTKSKNFDFSEANEQLLVERQRAEERRLREEAKAKKVGEKVQKLLDESRTDIERCLTECRTSMKLIFPDLFFDDQDAHKPEEEAAAGKAGEADVQLHGYKENDHLTVVIPTAEIDIEETPNNAALVDALRDAQVLLRKYEKSLKKWLKKLTQAGAVAENAALIRRLLELKAEVGHELKRADQLRIKKTKRRSSGAAGEESDSESEDEFEDVVKDGLELEMPEEEDELSADILQQIDSLEKRGKRKSNESALPSLDPDAPGPSGLNASGSRTKEDEPQKPKIPKLQFGLDLKYWGQEIEPATVVRNEFDGHAFWRAPDRDEPATELEDVYRSRQMTFLTEPPVIKHKCRAPLPSGKLCPRMDLKVCPFHGPIVPRDEMGFPVEELGKGSLLALKSAEERIRKHMEQDEKDYVQDVEAAVGLPLAANEKKKRGANRNKAYGTARKRERTQTELSRERLQTKLFSKSAMKRVTDTLTTIQKERAEKNFSNQFNYALTRR
ncbi:hypothetical protein M3Y99_01151300 [Aphelenchoides fujianensis]|nr:hypothetical protein M3Y99_01151300 [Aphelenchoides fujianensis]